MGIFAPFSFLEKDAPPAPPAPPYSSDLVRWFEADNPGGSPSSTWTDLSGNQDGTVGSDVSYVTSTPDYYDFDGNSSTVNNAIDASPSPITGTQNNTQLVWFRATSTENGVLSYIGDRTATTFDKITLRLASNGYLRTEFEGSGKTSSTLSYSTGTWYQAAAVLDGTRPADCTMYLNTSSDDCGTNTTTLDIKSTYAWAGVQNSFHPYSGRIGVWLIYNRALSASEIEEVFDYYKGNYGY